MTAAFVNDTRHGAVSHESTMTARLHGLLFVSRDELLADAAEHEATVAELTGQQDVDSILEREIAEASAARAREAIADIDHALARIDVGTYGTCESCGRTIPFERLEVIPQARLCVNCLGRHRPLWRRRP